MLAPPFFARRVLSQWTLVRAAFLFVVVLFVTYSGFLFTSGGDMPSMTDLQEAWAVGSDALGAYTEWVPWVGGASPEDEPIAICAAIKDESKDMVEWLVHHYHHMGIKRFYIMDDGSEPPLSTFEYPGVPRSALTFTYRPREMRQTMMLHVFYAECLENFIDRHKWMAFIDADEYLDTPGPETLPEVLASFEHNKTVGALGVSWRTHSSNGHLTRQPSVRKAYTQCVGDTGPGSQAGINRHVKSIVRAGRKAKASPNSHTFRFYPEPSMTVGEHGDQCEGPFREPTRDRVGLAHYALKSREEWLQKINRGSGNSNYKPDAFWTVIEEQTNLTTCNQMLRYDP